MITTPDVEYLRQLAVRSNDGYLCGPALQAADEIERLRAGHAARDAEVAANAERVAVLEAENARLRA
jgi:hypothetical protein